MRAFLRFVGASLWCEKALEGQKEARASFEGILVSKFFSMS